MSLTILSVAYPFARVGPDSVGGAEQVVARLDAALIRAGHRSIVVAARGSRIRGELIETPLPPGEIDVTTSARTYDVHRANVLRILATESIDLVHLHGHDFLSYLPPPEVPVLITLHLPPSWYPREVFELDRPRTYLHCVSASQSAACPPCTRLLPAIANGVSVRRLAISSPKRRFALALGRICPEKNFHAALDAGRAAGLPVLIGGRVFPYPDHLRYYDREIAPRLDRQHRFLGPLRFARKRRLLSAARCLLHPSLAPETSSLVAMEALACGTPVIAFRSGALSDIIDHGWTGYLVDSVEQMADAIHAARSISPEQCRAVARERFSAERMVSRYLALYASLATSPDLTPCRSA